MPRTASAPSAKAAHLFAALGEETRLGLVARLCKDGPLSIAELTSGTRVTRQAITKHLHALEQAGLVHSDRNGRQRLWEIRGQRLAEARQYLEAISAQWDGAIARLRKLVEDDRR
jgi:DNA-binding transcriptional ArsR family regulator